MNEKRTSLSAGNEAGRYALSEQIKMAKDAGSSARDPLGRKVEHVQIKRNRKAIQAFEAL